MTWDFERGKSWFGSIKRHEVFGSIKSHVVVKNWQNLVGSIKRHEYRMFWSTWWSLWQLPPHKKISKMLTFDTDSETKCHCDPTKRFSSCTHKHIHFWIWRMLMTFLEPLSFTSTSKKLDVLGVYIVNRNKVVKIKWDFQIILVVNPQQGFAFIWYH